MQRNGCWRPGQQMGERWPIACVALEITQRCNLDCTLCYLSEHSEATSDIPLAEVFRRIDAIRRYYGSGIDVQVTGGDPTLRPRDDLLAIVQRLADQGQHPTLMTNGIRARLSLLQDLKHAGLVDVVFHVDTTQERRQSDGAFYPSEASLQGVRERYIRRGREAGLNVMFNTTVHAGNVHEVSTLAKFFASRADQVRTASFQLHADTGRGVQRGRSADITMARVWSLIEAGFGAELNHDASIAGHPACTRYGLGLLLNGHVVDLLDQPSLVQALQRQTATVRFDRTRPWRTLLRLLPSAVWPPSHLPRLAGFALRKAWRAAWTMDRSPPIAPRTRIGTISFVIHDFMHACALEADRIDACVFKVQTGDGPLSMCVHNADRDRYILGASPKLTSELRSTGDRRHGRPTLAHEQTAALVTPPDPITYGLKRTKGRTRARLLRAKSQSKAAKVDLRAER